MVGAAVRAAAVDAEMVAVAADEAVDTHGETCDVLVKKVEAMMVEAAPRQRL